MDSYVALLRGVNVGGRMLKMADLKSALETDGFTDVKTFIQSGNVLFTSRSKDTLALAKKIENLISDKFNMDVPTLVLSAEQYDRIVKSAPKHFGQNPEWKHNVLFLIPPFDMDQVVAGIGVLKPDIESLVRGEGVLYQSMSIKLFGRTTTGKLAASPVYQQMTIRNWNTTQKLAALLQEMKNS